MLIRGMVSDIFNTKKRKNILHLRVSLHTLSHRYISIDIRGKQQR